MTIDQRLQRLESSNRIMKTALTACLLVVVLVVTIGATSVAPKVLDVQKLILRDEAGNERGQLFATEKAWGLVLFNKNQTKAASIFVMSNANGIFLGDENGNIRQTFTSSLNKSEWNIFRPGSDSAQFAVLDNEQGTALNFHDRANNDRIDMGVSAKGSAINMADANGGIRAVMEGGDIGFASFTESGEFRWGVGWDKFSPEEKARMQKLMPKLPN